jgi:hypothetical protein
LNFLLILSKNSKISFPNFTNAPLYRPTNLQKTCENSCFLEAHYLTLPYDLLVINNYTRGPLADANTMNSFPLQCWRSTNINFNGYLSGNFPYYVNTFTFMTLAWQTKERLLRWWVKCADNESRCLYYVWSACKSQQSSLSKLDLQFFSKNSSCSLFNFCITNTEQIAKNVWILNEKTKRKI